MLRRVTRQRREFLYRKGLEGKAREVYERKRKVRQALAEGKPLPTEAAAHAAAFDRAEELLDARTGAAPPERPLFDSEYARAGVEDPRIFVTTSRDASSRLQQFAKELLMVLPNAQKLNRGTHVVRELVDACRANGASDLVLVHEHRGDPDGMVVCHLPFGPTAYFALHNVVLRHDVAGADRSAVSTAYPHLVFDNFSTPLGERVMAILRYLFPVPKADAQRVVTFANRDDYVSFRHHSFTVRSSKKAAMDEEGHEEEEEEEEEEEDEDEDEEDETAKKAPKTIKGKRVELMEIGPRFEMRPYQIRLGTVENTAAEIEWVLHPFTNTAKKRRYL